MDNLMTEENKIHINISEEEVSPALCSQDAAEQLDKITDANPPRQQTESFAQKVKRLLAQVEQGDFSGIPEGEMKKHVLKSLTREDAISYFKISIEGAFAEKSKEVLPQIRRLFGVKQLNPLEQKILDQITEEVRLERLTLMTGTDTYNVPQEISFRWLARAYPQFSGTIMTGNTEQQLRILERGLSALQKKQLEKIRQENGSYLSQFLSGHPK
ncbi:MAG: hypothetical protein K9M51_02735 [Candidatus Gracilibacteria bacterium]|nr:hypothetical protein [Candidatus Gracilibacteria bacterium]